MLSFINVIAGISWEPEIRGALVVLVGSTVLFGSVWLLLTTNIGSRLSTLNSLTGFFGWMFIMGVVWWIYGGNVLSGDDPSWVPEETVYGDFALAESEDVPKLADATLTPAPEVVDIMCPGLVDATVQLQRARVVEDNVNLELSEFYTAPAEHPYCLNEQIGELLAVDAETLGEDLTAANEAYGEDDPRFLDDAELEAAITQAVDDEIRKDNQLSLSGLLSVSPEIIDNAVDEGILDFQDWDLVSSADAGEAQATASAFLVDQANSFSAPGDFLMLDTFQEGGKPKRASDGVYDRVANEIRNTVVFWHPKHTIVVEIRPTLDKPTIAGQAPPFPEIDPDGQLVSVVMVRDLGSKRLPAALITMGSLVIFLVLCWMLHVRDLELRRKLDEWDPASA